MQVGEGVCYNKENSEAGMLVGRLQVGVEATRRRTYRINGKVTFLTLFCSSFSVSLGMDPFCHVSLFLTHTVAWQCPNKISNSAY